ncbi:SigE family RNA polymerase sigma factor [Allorhizocola rhizosphaerae]|uniref:SigE family RNA polymerase sigma factor n=1 Tax=Allorhizocola rhizosphaerae TaxID=1872709 RepID=UPI000E3C051E|nr:SigE family RNA polymerase sigma factor [Allorhizocola rhizosphaerae]
MTDEGFREFVETRYGELLRTAFLLTGTHHAAEDLLQSSLLRLMDRWHSVDEPKNYLYRIMANQRVSVWRRLGARELLTDSLPVRTTPDTADAVVQRDELLSALDRLPARMRTVLVLRYWLDYSEADTAAMLGCSVGSVKSQASRGLAKLRTRLTGQEVLA